MSLDTIQGSEFKPCFSIPNEFSEWMAGQILIKYIYVPFFVRTTRHDTLLGHDDLVHSFNNTPTLRGGEAKESKPSCLPLYRRHGHAYT